MESLLTIKASYINNEPIMEADLDSHSPRSESQQEDERPNKKAKTWPSRRKPACQTCRRRKVRCDNGQPACGFCRANESECVYNTRKDGDNSYVWNLQDECFAILNEARGPGS